MRWWPECLRLSSATSLFSLLVLHCQPRPGIWLGESVLLDLSLVVFLRWCDPGANDRAC